MNSLQLVSKIRSKSDDLSKNITELLNANHNFSSLDKELLKKQCLDLYELMLKLKTDAELADEKNIKKTWEQIFPQKNNTPVEPAPIANPTPIVVQTPLEIKAPEIVVAPIIAEPTPIIESVNENNNELSLLLDTILDEELTLDEPNTEPIPETLAEPVVEPIAEPIAKANNFQQVIEWSDKTSDNMDTLLQKIELEEELVSVEMDNPVLVQDEKSQSIEKPLQEPSAFAEINIGKAVENKRIQYTVMPDKTLPLNSSFAVKEPTYNDKIAKNSPPIMVPMADKTIEAPIDNIKSAINLNKKISFVNELFKENVVEYAKAIDRLNNASDRNDAFRIQNELKHQYRWDNNHDLVQDLERLIKRRFA